MALPPPNYEDALLYPVTSGSWGEVCNKVVGKVGGDKTTARSPNDSLPSYDTACSSAHRFQLTSTPTSSPRRTGAGQSSAPRPSSRQSVGLSGTLSASEMSPALQNAQSRAQDVTGAGAHVHDVTIQVTRLEESGGRSVVSLSSSGAGNANACGSAPSQRTTRGAACSDRNSQRSYPATDIEIVTERRSSSHHSHGSAPQFLTRSSHSLSGQGGGDASRVDPSNPNGATCLRSGLGDHHLHHHHHSNRPRSEDMERRVSDSSQRPCPASRASRDLNLPGLRSHRSCSDAGMHEGSRNQVVSAAAGTARSASTLSAQPYSSHNAGRGCQHQHHRCHHHHHHHHHQHRSHSCIAGHDMGSDSNVHNCNRRAHSHSSISRLAVRGGGGGHRDRDQPEGGASHLSPSRRASSEEEEVTYVWKDNRVQVHHPRSGVTTPDLSVSGQHVQYIWRNGNVQRVVRGSNHEVLSAEIVPPRGEIKGLNYCSVFGLMALFVMAIVIAVVFVSRMLY